MSHIEIIPVVVLEAMVARWKARAAELRKRGERENFRKTGVPWYFGQPSTHAAAALEHAIVDLEREIQKERKRIITDEEDHEQPSKP